MEILKAENITVKLGDRAILNNVSFTIKAGESWAITGPSGAGKTTLLKVLSGSQFFRGSLTFSEGSVDMERKVVLVEQQHYFKSLSNVSNFYYQQRFNSHDADDAITVAEYLGITDASETKGVVKRLAELFGIDQLLSTRLIQLSNGENKRVQILRALEREPGFLLLDNPFTGLDAKSRQNLEQILREISVAGIHVIIVTSASRLPTFITHQLLLSVDGRSKVQAVDASHSHQTHDLRDGGFYFNDALLAELSSVSNNTDFKFAVRMKQVNIRYDREILKNINWEVRRGERWSLSGHNGSGKSTLLSLVNADNPQAYANEIYLFDKRRGSGESIWDIKKRTGFVSPELDLYFEKGITGFQVVASGLFDTIGLFRQISSEQSQLVSKWMELLQITHLVDRYLHQLSNSERRIVLLARALVKNPPLLILDEPCQGLDDDQIILFKNILDRICVTGNKTLIYVSHHESEIPSCVSRHLRLVQGEISN